MPNTKRKIKRFKVSNINDFIDKTCDLASKEHFFIRLENHSIQYPQGSFPRLIAFGAQSSLSLSEYKNTFGLLNDYYSKTNDWIFGYLSYDLKNDTEKLQSKNADLKNFPELSFFCPVDIIEIMENAVEIKSLRNPDQVFEEIINHKPGTSQPNKSTDVNFKPNISQKEYLEVINKLRKHIYDGDIYEINYCMEYSAKTTGINAYSHWQSLCEKSPTPFAAYFKSNNYTLMCSSPERFLKRNEAHIISQPIKGTIETGETDTDRQKNKRTLLNSEKERAENMMIVDLVRNDLAKSALPGSVKVDELFGIYEFRHLFHMISTVIAEKKKSIESIDIIKNAFPMGSMTGAPKIKVMELIEHYEKSKRGIFSGTVGFIDPAGNFDFNVIIRSLFYNSGTNILSYSVGSAITFDSDPQYEFEECQLKAKAIREIFAK